MRKTTSIALLALALSLFHSCEPKFDKFARPDWLAGKVFTQIEEDSTLLTFAECLRITGFDTIINTSGSYTVFAPTDEAWSTYLQENSYASINDIPMEELSSIVKYHIVQNPWTKEQLRSLDVWGWIDPTDETNDEPRGFKRETLLEDRNFKYGTKAKTGIDKDEVQIVDTLASSWYRVVYTDSRKYVPIFFKEYFDLYDLTTQDYEFYFGRSFEGNNDIYYHGAKVIGDEVFAENGFVYNVDKVITPAKNVYQLLTDEYDDKSYSQYLSLVNLFPSFEYNEGETFDQVGADLGLEVDSLFDLTFPDLTFNLTKERTKAPDGTTGLPGNVTIRYHHGMLAPTNTALEKMENEYLPGGSFWDGIDNAPNNIKRIIANAHMSINAIYKTDLDLGFYNGEQDIVYLDEASIIQKEYGSNASFLGIDDPIIPRAFSSVTGPVYLRKGYARVMTAIENSGLLPALKRERDPDNRYMLFVEQDQNSSADSSLLYEAADEQFFVFQISGTSAQRFNISLNDLRTLLLNHIAVREPTYVPRKEFIPNLAGNYLIFNNETGEVRGTAVTTEGYNGSTTTAVIPQRIDIDADNGSTWEISDWFSFSTSSVFLIVKNSFPEFYDLIVSAGLANTKLSQFTFMSESENYTVFAPNGAALTAVQADTLTGDDLERFILSHFVRKSFIFTDDHEEDNYYETLRPDESSTEYNLVNTKIRINPEVDEIEILASDGSVYTSVIESDSTNILAGQILTEGQATFPAMINNAVIHKIDKAFVVSEMDVTKK